MITICNFDFAILRTPMLPYNAVLQFQNSGQLLDTLLVDENFEEALFIASRPVHTEFLKLKSLKEFDHQKKQKLIETIIKYYIRMSTRCTPFGTFAGVSLLPIKNTNGSKVDLSKSKFVKKFRYESYFINSYLSNDGLFDDFELDCHYHLNTSLYQHHNKFYYLEYKFIERKNRQVHLTSVEVNSLLAFLAKKINGKGLKLSQIIKIIENRGYHYKEAKEYVILLIKNRFLISSFEPTVVGKGYLSQCNSIIRGNDKFKRVHTFLEDLKKIEFSNCNVIQKVKQTERKLSEYNPSTTFKDISFQVDTYRSLKNSFLGTDLLDQIKDGVKYLCSTVDSYSNNTLETFKTEFRNRYEKRKVSLLEALNPELGIGYPAKSQNLLDFEKEIFQPAYSSVAQDSKMPKLYRTLFPKIADAIATNKREIVLTDTDMINQPDFNLLETTFTAHIQVINSNNKNKSLVFLKSVGNPSAINLVSRFGHINKLLQKKLKVITSFEANNQDLIVADVVHCPCLNDLNVIQRPKLRNYQIPYLASPSTSREKILPLSDLLIEMKGDKLFLSSKKYKRLIKPNLGTAHVFSNDSALSVYRFLGDIQIQDSGFGIFFSLGAIHKDLDYCPRITYKKNIILSPAKWFIKPEELESYLYRKMNASLIDDFKKWRIFRKLPRRVVLALNDNHLLLDFENVELLSIFFKLIKKLNFIILEEFLFQDDQSFAAAGKSYYCNEILIPFYKK